MSVSQDGVLAYALPLSSDQLERRLAIVPNSYFTDAQQRFEKYQAREAEENGEPSSRDSTVIDMDWLQKETEEYSAASSTAQPATADWLVEFAQSSRKLNMEGGESRAYSIDEKLDEEPALKSIEEYAAAAARKRAEAGEEGAAEEEAALAAATAAKKAEVAAGMVHVHVHVRGGQAVARQSIAPTSNRKQRRRSFLASPETSSRNVEDVEAEADAMAAALALEEAEAEEVKLATAEMEAAGLSSPATSPATNKRPSLNEAALGSSKRHKPKTVSVKPESWESFRQQLGDALHLPAGAFKLRSVETGEYITDIEEVDEGLHVILQLTTGERGGHSSQRGGGQRGRGRTMSAERTLTAEEAALANAPVGAGDLEFALGEGSPMRDSSLQAADGAQGDVEETFERVEQDRMSLEGNRTKSPAQSRHRRSLSQESDDAMVLSNLAAGRARGNTGSGRGRRVSEKGGSPMGSPNRPRGASPQPLKKALSRGAGRPGLEQGKELVNGQPPAKIVAIMMVVYPTVLGLVETMVQVCLKAITSLFSFSLECGNQVSPRSLFQTSPRCISFSHSSYCLVLFP
jgi:hypothetical protein